MEGIGCQPVVGARSVGMNRQPITLDDEYSYPLHMTGQQSTLPYDEPRDVIGELHAVVKEVTGKEVPRPEKPRMGFLP